MKVDPVAAQATIWARKPGVLTREIDYGGEGSASLLKLVQAGNAITTNKVLEDILERDRCLRDL